MSEIYVYAPNADDIGTMGMCGALTPSSVIHTEERNGMSEIELHHPIDDTGRWSFLLDGYMLKAEVPVRTTPEIKEDGALVTTIEHWTTNKKIKPYTKSKGGKKKKEVGKGTKLIVVSKGETRHKCWKEVTVKNKPKRKYAGWIPISAIDYELTDEIPNDPEAIELVLPAWGVSEQMFRIYDHEVTETEVIVHARHIFYDLLGNCTTFDGEEYLADADDEKKTKVKEANTPTAVEAGTAIMTGCICEHDFEFHTNMLDTRAAAKWKRVNPVSALLDPEEGLCAQWGAELVRDDWDITVLREAGFNRGVRIEYGKNLLGVKCETDSSDVITRIIPIGQTAKGKELLLAGDAPWVDSPRINDYPTPHVYVLDLSSEIKAKGDKAADLTNARNKLKARAQEMFDDHCDDPALSLTVDFVNLGDTEEYKDYAQLENIYLYDRVRVKHPELQIDVLCEVVQMDWDCLLGRAEKIELGTVKYMSGAQPIAKWQVPKGLNAELVLALASVGAGQLADDSVSDVHLQEQSVTAKAIAPEAVQGEHIQAKSVTAEKLAAGFFEADEIKVALATIVLANLTTANIGEANIDWAQIGTLNAHLAELTQAYITTANIGEANIDWAAITELHTAVATIAKAQITVANIQEANINWAQIESLTARVATIARGEITTANIGTANIDWAAIATLTARIASVATAQITTANIENANISWADIEKLSAEVARIANAQIGLAQIGVAQIDWTNIGTANINWAQIAELMTCIATIAKAQITSANIVEADIDWANIVKLNAAVADIARAQITAATINAADIKWAEIKSLTSEIARIAEAQITDASIRNADIDWATIENLRAAVAAIAKAQITAANIESADIDWAEIDVLCTTIADIARAQITTATIDEADIKWAEIASLQASVIESINARIKVADIGYAQIKDLVSGTAIITEGVGGRLLISRLDVVDGNIVSLNADKINAGTLAVERLVIVGSNKSIVYSINNANGTSQLSQTTIDGGALTKRTITADRIVAAGITANELAAGSVTADKILALAINAGHIQTDAIEARHIKAGAITTNKLASDVGATLDISSNVAIRNTVSKAAYDQDIASISSQIDQTAKSISSTVTESLYGYVTQTQLDQSSTDLTISYRDELGSMSDQLNSYKEYVEAYQRFSAAGIELGKISGKFKAIFSEQALDFLESGVMVASISNARLNAPRAEIGSMLSIGKSENGGFFDFVTTPNGLAIAWRNS